MSTGSLFVIFAIVYIIWIIFKSNKRIVKKIDIVDLVGRYNDGDDDIEEHGWYKVAGVTHRNEDRSSRQQYIKKYVMEDAPAFLKFVDFKGELACEVYADKEMQRQVGYIARKDVKEVYDIITSGNPIEPIFSAKVGGTKDKKTYGARISILEDHAL